MHIQYICTYEIDTIIDKFIQTGYPTIKLDSVVDKIGHIFEEILGETQGYLRDENGYGINLVIIMTNTRIY